MHHRWNFYTPIRRLITFGSYYSWHLHNPPVTSSKAFDAEDSNYIFDGRPRSVFTISARPSVTAAVACVGALIT